MEKTLFATAKCKKALVCYYLIAEKERYGIEVEYGAERAILPGLTVLPQAVEGLLAAMARGAVTPVTAADIAQDWLQAGNP